MPISHMDKTITRSDAVNAVTAAANYLPTLEALDALSLLQISVRHQTGQVVAKARREGLSWTAIGEQLGMTRQAAHEKFRSVED